LHITQNRIILYKYDEFIVYVEKNGQFKKLNNLFEKYNNINILYNEKNINDIEKLRNFIKEFILNKKEVLNSLNTFCNQLNISLIDYLNDNEYSYNNFINLYNDLIINKNLDNTKQLNNLNSKDCLNNNKKGYNENKYNKIICDNNPNKYILLDCKTINGCEIADIYDKENKLLFHNKKIKN